MMDSAVKVGADIEARSLLDRAIHELHQAELRLRPLFPLAAELVRIWQDMIAALRDWLVGAQK